MGENFLDMKQVAEVFGCGRKKIRAMVDAGKLPTPIKRGRKFVWFESSVYRTLEKMRIASEKNVKASAFY